MSQDQFRLTFRGEALSEGLMDVRELGPSLLATGELIQNANRLVNGDRAQVAVKVKSDIQKGSFDIGLLLDQALIEQAKQFLQFHPQVKDAKDILEILFFYVAAPGISLFKFIKWLRGRHINSGQITFINNGIIEVQLGNDVTRVSETVLKLAQEESIRRAAQDVVAPLKKDGIDELVLDGGEGRSEIVHKSEVAYFNTGLLDGETLLENEREAVLEIVRLSFNPLHKWGLTDGTTTIRASINDRSFWAEVQGGLRFAKGDHIRALIRTRTFRTDAGDLKSEYSVEQVLRHMPRRNFVQRELS